MFRLKTATLAILLLQTSWLEGETYDIHLPSLPIITLDQQFPRDPQISIPKLQLYKQDLEFFRRQTLEGFNRALIIDAAEVDEASKRLETDNANGKVSQQDYQRIHGYLVVELMKLRRSGDYMATYYDYLNKYKSRMNWADDQIKAIETQNSHNRFEM